MTFLGEHSLATPAYQEKVDALIAFLDKTAIARDKKGGTAQVERDAIRQSGLLALWIPKQYGGIGASWAETLTVVRKLAAVDSSLAHVFAFQHLLLASTQLFGQPDQWEPWFEQTAKLNWFWGNALNPLDTRTISQPLADGFVFSGNKSFCSGATDSNRLLVSAIDQTTKKLIIAVLPTEREGIHIFQDWDNIGQRQTDSGSVELQNVRVDAHEVLSNPGPFSTPYSALRPLIAQQILTNIYIGIAEGAYQAAKQYTSQSSRAWAASGVDHASQDPYTLGHFGDFWIGLESSRLLAEKAAHLLDDAWSVGDQLTPAHRGEVAIATATAKVASAQVGLDITSRLFDVTGARATTASLGLDRFWRNIRTHSLHDPVDYKRKELGNWALNNEYPSPTFYS